MALFRYWAAEIPLCAVRSLVGQLGRLSVVVIFLLAFLFF